MNNINLTMSNLLKESPNKNIISLLPSSYNYKLLPLKAEFMETKHIKIYLFEFIRYQRVNGRDFEDSNPHRIGNRLVGFIRCHLDSLLVFPNAQK